MPDREKVIKAWEIFRDSNPYEICSGREFRAIREPEYCMGQMIEDTIELLKKFGELQERHKILVEKADDMYSLLKEQEAVEPKQIVRKQCKIEHSDGSVDYYAEWFCPHCNSLLKRGFDATWIEYCFKCGKPITWEGR